MRADPQYASLPKSFWAHVRAISQELGYTERGKAKGPGRVSVYTEQDVRDALVGCGLSTNHLNDEIRGRTLGSLLSAYSEHRAHLLNSVVEPLLMDAPQAKKEFEALRRKLRPRCPLPKNKQKGEKSGHAFLTGMVNMLIEANCGSHPVDYDPRKLTTFTHEDMPVRTLARRVDGCFPSSVNPIAIWEIKEYYYTTTFGSRVADGVYETLLDGLELEELREHEAGNCEHLLIVDSRFTWWECGRSYLCRIIDMLHMGYVDEVLFGREIISRLPTIVQRWKQDLDAQRDGAVRAPVGREVTP